MGRISNLWTAPSEPPDKNRHINGWGCAYCRFGLNTGPCYWSDWENSSHCSDWMGKIAICLACCLTLTKAHFSFPRWSKVGHSERRPCGQILLDCRVSGQWRFIINSKRIQVNIIKINCFKQRQHCEIRLQKWRSTNSYLNDHEVSS